MASYWLAASHQPIRDHVSKPFDFNMGISLFYPKPEQNYKTAIFFVVMLEIDDDFLPVWRVSLYENTLCLLLIENRRTSLC